MRPAIPDIIARRALLGADDIAFRELANGTAVSYGQLETRSQRTAGLLQAHGIEAGHRVAIICRNRIEFFDILFACAKLGAILVPLNWRMPAAELQPLVDEASPGLLFFGAEDRQVANTLGKGGLPAIGLDDPGTGGYQQLSAQAEAVEGRGTWPADECWYVLYTSGTTGLPKAVIQTYGMAIANYVNIRQGMGITGKDVTLNFLPLFHTAGINLVTLPTLIEGGEVLITAGFDLEKTIELLRDGLIDTMFAVPAVYQQISLHADFSSLDLGKVRSWGCGGAPLPEGLITRYLERGARICNGMGMTETGPTVFLMDEKAIGEKIGSVGKPQVLASVRIVDASGEDVASGDEGELWFAGPGVTPGYWSREEATRDAFSDDGWFKSCDVGRRDADGYYYIVGRTQEMYISGGENIYPAEVESHLAAHPDILEAAVVAKPDQTWGEVGSAYVLPRPGHRLPEPTEITRFCRERMAAYKVPKQFIQVDDFPRTASGKIQKHLLGDT